MPGHPPESLDGLRTIARILLAAGAVCSLGFLLHAGRNSPRLLVVIMAIWILAPFAALAAADVLSKSWPAVTRKTLYVVMTLVTVTSLAVYWHYFVTPRKSQAAAPFVMVPVVATIFSGILVGVAAVAARRKR